MNSDCGISGESWTSVTESAARPAARLCPLGSVSSYLIHADVRFHAPMTHNNDRYMGMTEADCAKYTLGEFEYQEDLMNRVIIPSMEAEAAKE